MSAKDYITIQHYQDCHASSIGYEADESALNCSTWAHHVSLVLTPGGKVNPMRVVTLGIDLDRVEVQQLVGQLQAWLEKVGE